MIPFPCFFLGYEPTVLETGLLTSDGGQIDTLWPMGGFDGGFLNLYNRPAALSGFTVDKASGDFNFARLAILPMRESVTVVYGDRTPVDDYQYQVYAVQLPTQSRVQVIQVPVFPPFLPGTGNGCTTVAVDTPDGYTPVLVGFDLTFGLGGDIFIPFDDDHPLLRIKVHVYTNGVTVCLQDNNGDENYWFTVFVANVPDCFVHSTGNTGRMRNGGGGSATTTYPVVAQAQPVLTGFDFQFDNGEHEIDRIGAVLRNGQIYGFFDDQNDDDPYFWQVWYAQIQPAGL